MFKVHTRFLPSRHTDIPGFLPGGQPRFVHFTSDELAASRLQIVTFLPHQDPASTKLRRKYLGIQPSITYSNIIDVSSPKWPHNREPHFGHIWCFIERKLDLINGNYDNLLGWSRLSSCHRWCLLSARPQNTCQTGTEITLYVASVEWMGM